MSERRRKRLCMEAALEVLRESVAVPASFRESAAYREGRAWAGLSDAVELLALGNVPIGYPAWTRRDPSITHQSRIMRTRLALYLRAVLRDGGSDAMREPSVHALVTPWPLGDMHTWCGTPIAEAGGYAACSPEAVTCTRCARSMRSALETLTVWVPRLEVSRG